MEWDAYFMGIAEAVSKKSHCFSHHFGAIAVDADNCIVSTGYNGPPRGYPHCKADDIVAIEDRSVRESNTCPRRMAGYKSGQGIELCPAAHAERNVLINAARFGNKIKGCRLYITSMTPCHECAKSIVNAGIVSVTYLINEDYPNQGITGREILEKCGVSLIRYG